MQRARLSAIRVTQIMQQKGGSTDTYFTDTYFKYVFYVQNNGLLILQITSDPFNKADSPTACIGSVAIGLPSKLLDTFRAQMRVLSTGERRKSEEGGGVKLCLIG